ncbi:hypothetical protein J8244_09475 [Corynebacterium tuberculostearicum]|uniref:hypothetical protein n=1 Tax=Corynebacterium tuberculostearicum TaxID=38304 RepID=UPI0026659181|nr:hypothetical protein [Corynebacterium tuberculostearicum]WKE50351.1 hypothetical protein J8244_09475 [Corynebacterium tuberculostearicum]
MSNLDQAAEVIRTWQRRHKNAMDSNPDWAAQNLAIDLHKAGLITPDAPQPYFEYAGGPIWEVNNGYSIEKERPGEITVSYHGEPAEPITPQEARSLAAALLAAANYLEEA